MFVNTPQMISGFNGSNIKFSTKTVYPCKTIIEYPPNPGWGKTIREEIEWVSDEFVRFTKVSQKVSNHIIEKKSTNGILMEEKIFNDIPGAITQVYVYSVVEGTGSYRYYRDNILRYEAVLIRNLNPLGFLEYENINTGGSENIYIAEIIPKR